MDTEGFVEAVDKAVKDGYGFVPFIGAGFSAPSGVPLIVELETYLQRCICIALRLNDKGDEEPEDHQSWSPRTDQWPPLVDRGNPKSSGYWPGLLLKKIAHDGPVVENNKTAPLPENEQERRVTREERARKADWLKMYSEGYGAMQDWRTALLFLSRIDIPIRGNQPTVEPPRLVSPQPEVIDACFREVLRGRYPTLGHRMLGALAGALRIDLVLTTNFDDLLERAFETARNPLEVFEVMLDGSLPRRTEIENRRTLVKLHGGRVALRADYSLDDLPDPHDRDQFLSYLMSPGGRSAYALYKRELLKNPNANHPSAGYRIDKHLLLIGFSGTDARINHLVTEALARLEKDFQVFWIYFSDDDKTRLEKKYEGHPTKVHLIPCTSAGFLLLELYQRLRQSLPPLGSIFPSASRLTLPPITPRHVVEKLETLGEKTRFTKKLNDLIWSESGGVRAKVVIAFAEDKTEGLTSSCVETFNTLEKSPSVLEVWVDMNNVSSADSLYEVLLEAVHYRIGVEEWIPSTTESSARDEEPYARRAEEFARLLKSVNKRWVFFLNAREQPGANAYENSDWAQNPIPRNGWLDNALNDLDAVHAERIEAGEDAMDEGDPHAVTSTGERPTRERETANLKAFVELIRALCSKKAYADFPEQAFLTFVVVATKTDGRITDPYTWASVDHHILSLAEGKTLSTIGARSAADKCFEWAGGGDNRPNPKQRFLHALVLMQRPRFPAALLSSAFFTDAEPNPSGEEPQKFLSEYLRELEEKGLVRRKPGGMIWVHSQCRNRLREAYKDDPDTGEIHVELASWYEKAIDASDSPDAVFEAAYHFVKAAQAFQMGKAATFGHKAREANLKRATSLVKAATAKISSESYLIQTHGYSRGSCRQLGRLADIGQTMRDDQGPEPEPEEDREQHKAFREAIFDLWMACLETMRAIAREVGEDGKAFMRQRQIASLYENHSTSSWAKCRAMELGLSDEPIADGRSATSEKKWGKRTEMMFALYDSNKDVVNKRCVWRWLRWMAMLDIASRAFNWAEYYLHPGQALPVPGLGSLKSQEKYDPDANPLNENEDRIEFLRTIEKAVELQLLRFGVERRCEIYLSTLKLERDGPLKDRLQHAEAMIRRGMKLAAKIRDTDCSSDSRDAAQASWCETRLLVHLSMVHVCGPEVGFKPNQPRDPLGILSDAEAKLRVSNPQRTRSDLALIDLHRADVKLHSQELRNINEAIKGFAKGNLSADQIVANAYLRQGAATAADAIRFLERAESVMRERRRNVWWTSWYFERKLRTIAYSVMASCAEKGSPIPFLGLEAAMRVTETEADRLLKDAQRMIRVDAYRMASVVDAYASCIIALVARLVSDPDLPRLPLRLDAMLGNLSKAVERVELIMKQREKVKDLDDAVRAYTSGVGPRIHALLASHAFSDSLNRARRASAPSNA